MASLKGTCPTIGFILNGTAVFATAATKFRAGNCKHLEEGTRVIVVGERQADGRVRADRIDIDKKH